MFHRVVTSRGVLNSMRKIKINANYHPVMSFPRYIGAGGGEGKDMKIPDSDKGFFGRWVDELKKEYSSGKSDKKSVPEMDKYEAEEKKLKESIERDPRSASDELIGKEKKGIFSNIFNSSEEDLDPEVVRAKTLAERQSIANYYHAAQYPDRYFWYQFSDGTYIACPNALTNEDLVDENSAVVMYSDRYLNGEQSFNNAESSGIKTCIAEYYAYKYEDGMYVFSKAPLS